MLFCQKSNLKRIYTNCIYRKVHQKAKGQIQGNESAHSVVISQNAPICDITDKRAFEALAVY